MGLTACIKENKWLWAVLLYSILLHLAGCLAFYIGKMNSTIGNPFIQGLWGWLALFGLAILAGGRIAKIILSLLISLQTVVGILAIFLSLIFSLSLRADAIAVLEVSSVQEIREFCGMFLNFRVLLGILAGVAVLVLALIAVWKNPIRRSVWLSVIVGILILPMLINVIRFSVKGDYDDIYEHNSIGKLIAEILTYRKETRNISAMVQHPQTPPEVCCMSTDENFTAVFVLGESATRFHHSIYDYPRETSPLLSGIRNELFVFTDVISGYAHTAQSCLFMFSTEDKEHRKDYRYTMFDVFKAAGFKIYLYSNQARWGRYDSPISMVTAHADGRVYVQEEKPDILDDFLLTKFDRVIREKGKKFIVLHLMGSHRRYESQSPVSFKRFNEKNRIPTPYAVDDWSEVDEYDNSILFTDSILRQIADRLKKYDGAAFMLYCSDHGDFPEQAVSTPRSGSSKSPEHYEIPFILYVNPVYREKYSAFLKDVEKNTGKPFMTDHLMFPMFSAARITFAGFPHQDDLFSPEFIPPARRKLGDHSICYRSRRNPYAFPEKKRPADPLPADAARRP